VDLVCWVPPTALCSATSWSSPTSSSCTSIVKLDCGFEGFDAKLGEVTEGEASVCEFAETGAGGAEDCIGRKGDIDLRVSKNFIRIDFCRRLNIIPQLIDHLRRRKPCPVDVPKTGQPFRSALEMSVQ
jgi:hypothetical protein